MCIGNLRSGMDSLCSWLVAGNRAAKDKALHYFAIIFLFALGAALGSVALNFCGAKAIWFSCLLLTVSFCLMFLKEDVEEIKEDLALYCLFRTVRADFPFLALIFHCAARLDMVY